MRGRLPALRIGYLVVPARLIEVFSRAKWLADRHSPLLEQQALADFIKLGHLERHVRRMRSLYEGKRELVFEDVSLQRVFETIFASLKTQVDETKTEVRLDTGRFSIQRVSPRTSWRNS